MNCENLIEQIKYEVEIFISTTGEKPKSICMSKANIEELKRVFKSQDLVTVYSNGLTLKVLQNNELKGPYVC